MKKIAKPLGYLRWLNQREDLGLKFADLNFASLLDHDTLLLDFPHTVLVVVQRSNHPEPPLNVRTRCEALVATNHDSRHLCSGHDLVAILAVGLRRVLGSQRSNDVQVETIELELRLAFDWDCFTMTQIYGQFRAWEARNAGWKVLAPQ